MKGKQTLKYIWGLAAVALLVAAGTILPEELALGRDKVILGQVQSAPLDAAETSDYVNISMVDKAGLLGQASEVTPVPLQTGAGYSRDSIQAGVRKELQKLYELRLLPPLAEEGWVGFSAGVTLRIQNDAPDISMILWEVSVRAEGYSGVFYLDDQTGKILGYSFIVEGGEGRESLEGFDYTEELVRAWAGYLGADVRNIKKEAPQDEAGEGESRYRFELYAGLRSVGGQMVSLAQPVGDGAARWEMYYKIAP